MHRFRAEVAGILRDREAGEALSRSRWTSHTRRLTPSRPRTTSPRPRRPRTSRCTCCAFRSDRLDAVRSGCPRRRSHGAELSDGSPRWSGKRRNAPARKRRPRRSPGEPRRPPGRPRRKRPGDPETRGEGREGAEEGQGAHAREEKGRARAEKEERGKVGPAEKEIRPTRQEEVSRSGGAPFPSRRKPPPPIQSPPFERED